MVMFASKLTWLEEGAGQAQELCYSQLQAPRQYKRQISPGSKIKFFLIFVLDFEYETSDPKFLACLREKHLLQPFRNISITKQ